MILLRFSLSYHFPPNAYYSENYGKINNADMVSGLFIANIKIVRE